MSHPEDHIPDQRTGAETDTESEQIFTTEEDAVQFYAVVKQRLLQVNRWQEWAGAATAAFWLTDAAGNEVERHPQAGDHFKIDIPGPGTQTGDGFDWVRVEEVTEEHQAGTDSLLVQVRPAHNPKSKKEDVAHFFTDEATSNFLIKREGNRVSAGVHGRNEKPNTHADALVDKARNAAVATGAVSGFSKLQWKALVNGLVNLNNKSS